MTKGRKVRQDSWTKAEDDVLIKIIYRFVREGRTQMEAFEYAAHRTGRTGAACGFRWNKELRGDIGVHNEFVRNRNIGRLHNKKVKSVRTDQWAEDWKDRDRYSNDALKEAYDSVYKAVVPDDEPTPLATAFIESLAKIKPTLEKTPLQEIADYHKIANISNVGRDENTAPDTVLEKYPSSFEQELTELALGVVKLLVKKNHDYGDSIYETYKLHGDLSMAIRIGDKARRLDVLTSGKEAQVNESIEDIYMDSAGYNLMGLYAKKRLAEEGTQ